MTYQIVDLNSPEGLEAINGARPIIANNGQVYVNNGRGLRVNSLLRKDEWEELDRAVVEAGRNRLNGIMHLQSRGLVTPLSSLGTIISQYNKSSQMTAADVTITGHAVGNQDRVDFTLTGVPVPVIFKEYTIPRRQLEASRRLGEGIDVTNAFEAASVVSEGLEAMLFNGNNLVYNASSIFGYTTETNRNTDTATNYGGGDWGTITNVVATISGMIGAANGDGYYGPFGVYASTTQYNQAATAFYTDGSGESARERALRMPMVELFEPSDWLADGVIVLVQLTRNVVDLAVYQLLSNVEWLSGDGMVGHFKIMSIAVPRVKSDYGTNSGIVHATGA